ncbi:MAG: argininosuccinate lyase [Spirochaetales bacterium]|nr:argininosuccinate lyase [Spirochaetales bacterium]
MAKIWQKNYTLNALVEEFTVGSDYLLDADLVVADCLGSIAHARMLEKIGILTAAERQSVEDELKVIAREGQDGRFIIKREEEDCHTAIENRLTETVGEAGKKIHTGRSRNDQVLTALRLYERSFLLELARRGVKTVLCLTDFAAEHRDLPMPGLTHMRIAMPSSVGLWAGAFAEEVLGHLSLLPAIYDLVDQCPLGSAASYGVPLPLDREMTAGLLGFSRVQNNVLYAANSRSGTEGWILTLAEQLGVTLSRLAQDLILFSMPEFGYFSLPDELCSGSSIMPQKKNPDALELLRAKAVTLGHAAAAVRGYVHALPSGYNRDIQESKEPFAKASRTILLCLEVTALTIENLVVHPQALAAACSPEIFATDAVMDLVSQGMSFRDAYRRVAEQIEELPVRNPADYLQTRTSSGAPGNLRLDLAVDTARKMEADFAARRARIDEAFGKLCGFVPAII